ncbi:MAG: amidase [Cyanobacteria bacterium]|nr:amidase [Cyanobacteriota bacterium]
MVVRISSGAGNHGLDRFVSRVSIQEGQVDVIFASARDLAKQIRSRRISAREVMTAFLAQIERLNPQLNAIVAKLDDDQCLALADKADHALGNGGPIGPLHGLPIAFKDLEPAIGFPQSKGSPIFRNFMPDADSVLVGRLRRAGAIPIGKTNVPEFGMGSQTYNNVYGVTRNPYDPTKTAGGSSGGAAVAVAAGMLPLADGGDLGGSLRNPANFNNIVALRPSPELVPIEPVQFHNVFSTKGMLARTVDDLSFGLGCVANQYNSQLLAGVVDGVARGARVAWCPDLGGLPLDSQVRRIIDGHRKTFEDLGCVVEDACPDFGNVDEDFMTCRQWASWNTYRDLLGRHRDQLKPEAVWEIEAGSRLNAEIAQQAFFGLQQLMTRFLSFQTRHQFLVCAVNQVPPFDHSVPWPTSIDGSRMENYISWMKSTYWISATLCPAMSVPAGFTDDGLPVGIQIVGRINQDFNVLSLGQAFEQATGFGRRRPKVS